MTPFAALMRRNVAPSSVAHHLIALLDEAFEARQVAQLGVGLRQEVGFHLGVGDALAAGLVLAGLAVVQHGAVARGPALVARLFGGHAPLQIDLALIHAVGQIAVPVHGLGGVRGPQLVQIHAGVVQGIVHQIVADLLRVDVDAGFLLLARAHGADGRAAQARSLVKLLDEQGLGSLHGGEVRSHEPRATGTDDEHLAVDGLGAVGVSDGGRFSQPGGNVGSGGAFGRRIARGGACRRLVAARCGRRRSLRRAAGQSQGRSGARGERAGDEVTAAERCLDGHDGSLPSLLCFARPIRFGGRAQAQCAPFQGHPPSCYSVIFPFLLVKTIPSFT